MGQEGEPVDFSVLLEAVQLHAGVVVDEQTVLLGHCKHHLIVQIPGTSNTSNCSLVPRAFLGFIGSYVRV